MTLNIAVLASTKGTDLQAIIDSIAVGKLGADIKCVISNKENCGAMEKARTADIEAVFIDPAKKEREEFDREVAAELEKMNVELVVLVGYMRFLSPWFVQKYENRIMNIHPSLLPAFAGGMDVDVHQAVLDRGCKITGCTIHFVDEGADTGPIIMQKVVKVEKSDTTETLKEKVQAAEMEAYPEAIQLFADKKLKVEGNSVKIL